MNMSEYRVHLCIGPTLFPPNFVQKSECDLYMLLEFFKFENAFKLSRYFRHPVYGYVMAKLLLREVTGVRYI